MNSVLLLGFPIARRAEFIDEFAGNGWRVSVARQPELVYAMLVESPVHVLICGDEALGAPILEVLRDLRQTTTALIIVLSTDRYKEAQTEAALQLGADDVQHVSLQPRELRTRAEVLLRRRRMLAGGERDRFGDVRVDHASTY